MFTSFGAFEVVGVGEVPLSLGIGSAHDLIIRHVGGGDTDDT